MLDVAAVHGHAAWYISRSVPESLQRGVLHLFCEQHGFGVPPWDGELKGETPAGAVGRRLTALFLVDDEGDACTAEVGTVTAVRPYCGIDVLFSDGPLTITDEDEWEWVRE